MEMHLTKSLIRSHIFLYISHVKRHAFCGYVLCATQNKHYAFCFISDSVYVFKIYNSKILHRRKTNPLPNTGHNAGLLSIGELHRRTTNHGERVVDRPLMGPKRLLAQHQTDKERLRRTFLVHIMVNSRRFIYVAKIQDVVIRHDILYCN